MILIKNILHKPCQLYTSRDISANFGVTGELQKELSITYGKFMIACLTDCLYSVLTYHQNSHYWREILHIWNSNQISMLIAKLS